MLRRESHDLDDQFFQNLGFETLLLLLAIFVISTITLFVHDFRLQQIHHGLQARCAPYLRARAVTEISRDAHPPSEQNRPHPPIIVLRETQGYTFPLGSAVVSEFFSYQVRNVVVPTITHLAMDTRLDLIEVVGHTDEVALRPRPSNLDQRLLLFWQYGGTVMQLQAADNAGLGMARAVSVARLLKLDSRLNSFTIVPFSAGQLIATDGTITPGDQWPRIERRRIEIRIRRRGQ